MNLRLDLTQPECDYFRSVCNFTEDERKVFDLLVKDKSIVFISMQLNISQRTVGRRIRNIKQKIQKVI